MSNLLVLTSSASGADSVSNLLVEDAVAEIVVRQPDIHVVRRDLDREPLPHLTHKNVAGVRAQAASEAEAAASALSHALIAELKAADLVVIGAPMYNFSIPTTLRAWFDHVLRPGVTFGYSEGGPKGYVEGKRVLVIQARGGLYSEGPGQATDFQEPYLRQLLGFIGLTDVTFVHAEKIGFGPQARAEAVEAARAAIERFAAEPTALAA
jgi:FMN-dependent NADH-azoreductase